MARIYFTYERKYVGIQTGTVSVDVDDPADLEQMRHLLKEQDFATFLPEQNEIQTTNWDFKIKNLN